MKIIDKLQKHEIFTNLNAEDLKAISKITYLKTFEKDQIIFYERKSRCWSLQ